MYECPVASKVLNWPLMDVGGLCNVALSSRLFPAFRGGTALFSFCPVDLNFKFSFDIWML